MTASTVIRPLTVGRLARDLAARAGQPVPALRCYESLAALWIRGCDTGLPGAQLLQEMTSRAALRLAAGENAFVAPEYHRIPNRLLKDESLVRLPASLAVQGVEWQDAIALAQAWLEAREWAGPVLVAGVRTGGAYLAPLVAAQLDAEGVDVRLTSVRPGERPEVGDRRVLLVDDPPLTGRTLRSLAREVPGPAGAEVLVPVFDAADVRSLREDGIAVTVLPREQWQSTRRLEPETLSAYLTVEADWQDVGPAPVVDGLVPGRENSALAPWPGLRRRSAVKAAVRLRTPKGIGHAVAGWVPPGIFGDAARAAATSVRSPVPPATLAVAPALVISEDLTLAAPLAPEPTPHQLEEAVDYVLARARHLPMEPAGRGAPMPAVLGTVTRAITGEDGPGATGRLHRLLSAMAPALPDNRCEAEKWFLDASGRLRKTGHLAHPYRRDNELLTPLLDLAALTVAFGSGLEAVAEALTRRLPGGRSWHAALAVALLCYGTARGEQLPRTYNPQRAAETAVEAYRLQRGMSEAAGLLQHVLNDTASGRESAVPRVLRRWAQPPGALVQPRLPFDGAPAPESGPVPEDKEREMTLKAVARWAKAGQFHPVRERQGQGQVLLLAPVDGPASWDAARAALEELAGRLPRPGLLGWCGVPVVTLDEAG
ncbi:phosphoribosyltransferase family protein [Streptomyces anulatus]|uniref:phosphoribosyltransferase family protein n=1 Tax=Streptomyces anulatus TaxID=1892 RepID=UPI003F49D074